MKTTNFFVACAIIFTAFIAGCSGGKTQNKLASVDDLLANPETFIGQTVAVEGICTHVCSKSGMKLFIEGENTDNTLRVESNNVLGKFDPASVEKKVRVEGTLVEEKITEADLLEMEKEILAGTNIEHGEGGEGCATEQKAEGVAVGSSEMDRVNDFRARIAERKAAEGKDYISFYHLAADSYRIVE